MKTRRLFGSRYVVMGVVGASIILAACSSSGGGGGQTPETATPLARSTPTSVPTTAASTPTSVPATVARTPTPTPAPARPSTSPASTGREIKVTLKDNTFPEEIRVKVGERVVFVVTNNSEAGEKHNFELPDFDVAKEIRPGETVRIEWLVPNKKGKWDAGCYRTEEGYHEGMEGVLIIE